MTASSINDPVLGELRPLDAFQHGREVSLDGREIPISIETAEGLTPEAVAQARRIVGELAPFAKRIKQFAAENLLELKNDDWAGDDPVLTAHDLELRLSFDACDISTDGCATIYLGDGELFGGHSVLVSVDQDGGIQDVKLAG